MNHRSLGQSHERSNPPLSSPKSFHSVCGQREKERELLSLTAGHLFMPKVICSSLKVTASHLFIPKVIPKVTCSSLSPNEATFFACGFWLSMYTDKLIISSSVPQEDQGHYSTRALGLWTKHIKALNTFLGQLNVVKPT